MCTFRVCLNSCQQLHLWKTFLFLTWLWLYVWFHFIIYVFSSCLWHHQDWPATHFMLITQQLRFIIPADSQITTAAGNFSGHFLNNKWHCIPSLSLFKAFSSFIGRNTMQNEIKIRARGHFSESTGWPSVKKQYAAIFNNTTSMERDTCDSLHCGKEAHYQQSNNAFRRF